MDVEALTKQLLEIPSPSGEEGRVGRLLARRLAVNFKVRTQKAGRGFNVLATAGDPRLLLTTHMDTVPKQLKVREDSEYIYGRGACDAKGIAAAMICAGEAAIRSGCGGFGLLFDVDEETGLSGIRKAVKLVKPELVVVGEPTKLRVVRGQKGLLALRITCRGRAAPAATPAEGRSAIDDLISILGEIRALRLPRDPVMGDTTLNIGRISGGTAQNVVADYAYADVEFRTSVPNTGILKKVERAAAKAKIKVEADYDYVLVGGSSMERQFKQKAAIAPYFTEMFFWKEKSEVAVFGPGDYGYAHSDNEKIAKKDLREGVAAYLKIIRELAP
ncbi:MAG TPA: M20/M25/M40 family metallo-hydrolase [Candidatus Saccharimonadales bacterium]|nr:M20/M25/M40 family metallo-hydrolase [Candidatus Saccharimonadales bacterium]